jgi:hypothetical protein
MVIIIKMSYYLFWKMLYPVMMLIVTTTYVNLVSK